jgi:hypothetical protein
VSGLSIITLYFLVQTVLPMDFAGDRVERLGRVVLMQIDIEDEMRSPDAATNIAILNKTKYSNLALVHCGAKNIMIPETSLEAGSANLSSGSNEGGNRDISLSGERAVSTPDVGGYVQLLNPASAFPVVSESPPYPKLNRTIWRDLLPLAELNLRELNQRTFCCHLRFNGLNCRSGSLGGEQKSPKEERSADKAQPEAPLGPISSISSRISSLPLGAKIGGTVILSGIAWLLSYLALNRFNGWDGNRRNRMSGIGLGLAGLAALWSGSVLWW